MRHVIVTHVFDVRDGVPDEDIWTIVGTMTVQVEEPVVGYSDEMAMNELTIDVANIDVGAAIEDRPHIPWADADNDRVLSTVRDWSDEEFLQAFGFSRNSSDDNEKEN